MSDCTPTNLTPEKAEEKGPKKGFASRKTAKRKGNASSEDNGGPGFGWGLATLAIVVLVGCCLLLHQCQQPPPARPADAPESQFSAQRALERLKRLLGTGAPHPLGTSANKQVVDRLVAELGTLGLQPVIKEHWVSNDHRLDPKLGGRSSRRDWLREWCRVRNVSAEMASANPDRPAILLACHHDSVGAGPGAADDGAAVATLLEVARALKEGPPLPRPVILLFTDGEEVGLMGAQGFVDHDPLAERVGMVVNFEARGVSGGSLMFETSRNNRWIIAQASAGLTHPMSSSSYVEIYRLMPNSSDLAIFMEDEPQGKNFEGMNFGVIGGPRHYHTPGDNLANLDRRSLQHHGDNALGMVRQLLKTDWPDADDHQGDAVYTDLFARRILAWPAAWGPWIAGLTLIVLLWSFARLRKQWRWSGKEISATTLAWVMVLVIAGLLSCLGFVPRVLMGDTQTPFPVAMYLDLALFCSSAIIGIVLSLLLISRRPELLFVIHSLALALLGLVLSLTKTGFSYLFLLPAAVAAAGSFLLQGSGRSPLRVAVPCLAVAVVTAMAWYPLFFRLPLALGLTFLPGSKIPVAPVFGVILAILVLPILPLFLGLSRKAIAAASVTAGLVAVTFLVLALQSKPFSEEEPQRVSLVHVEQEGQETALLLAVPREGSVPSTFTAGMAVIKGPDPLKLIVVPKELVDEVTAISTRSAGLSAPTMKVLARFTASGCHTAHILLRPARDSQNLLIGIPAPAVDLGLLKISGRSKLDPVPQQVRANHRWLGIRGAPPEGVELVLSWVGPKDWNLIVAGVNYGLPAGLAPVARTRDSLPACPSHEGDRTVILNNAKVGNPDP